MSAGGRLCRCLLAAYTGGPASPQIQHTKPLPLPCYFSCLRPPYHSSIQTHLTLTMAPISLAPKHQDLLKAYLEVSKSEVSEAPSQISPSTSLIDPSRSPTGPKSQRRPTSPPPSMLATRTRPSRTRSQPRPAAMASTSRSAGSPSSRPSSR